MEKLYFQDGETLTEYTPEQYAQHAKDIAEIRTRKAIEDAVEAQFAKDKASGEAKLLAVGLTKAEIKAIAKDK